ncbi:hypothetical protein F5B20DRAFT_427400 [Whalleya microplaca]|nr:hypothetical protein F5B20DRAFT_427400 [Whalleya microplaca]
MKVKKFFSQRHVEEELKPEFRLYILQKELLRLSSGDTINVLVDSWTKGASCGVPIEIARGSLSVGATLGDLIVVEIMQDKRLYGLTAGHPLKKLRCSRPIMPIMPDRCGESGSDSDSDLETVSESDSRSSDGEAEVETSDSSNAGLNPPDETDLEEQNGKSARSLITIGTITYDTFSTHFAENYDWALVDLTLQEAQPNTVVLERGPVFRNHPLVEETAKTTILFIGRSRRQGPPVRVAVVSHHGLQRGILNFNSSCLLMAPGLEFVDTYELALSLGSRLSPGDSGSWVVNESTGEVYGHVVSIDAFGEAQVMPILSTLESIRMRLDAYRVSFPTLEDICSMRRGLSTSRTGELNDASCTDRDGRSGMDRSSLNPEAEPFVPSMGPSLSNIDDHAIDFHNNSPSGPGDDIAKHQEMPYRSGYGVRQQPFKIDSGYSSRNISRSDDNDDGDDDETFTSL